jgi:hypothetical protein
MEPAFGPARDCARLAAPIGGGYTSVGGSCGGTPKIPYKWVHDSKAFFKK